ncbi:MAG: NAD-dependent epimerase/dehydratase family protein [Ignavibacteria bacterium]|nr:NAD-dependent epimerase/dehydratase family protein [Ignavibacteria bacterium]
MQVKNKKVLITGAAGFIGFHLVKKLAQNNFDIVGLDNLNEYYDPKLKHDRLKQIGISIDTNTTVESFVQSETLPNFKFVRMDLIEMERLTDLFKIEKFDIVVHLAAQAGVRFSIESPEVYIQSNIIGFFNILECSKNNKVNHLIYASSSSVYGNNEKVPFSETDSVDFPISMYAATKKSNELMAHTYSHIHKLPTTGLRFFTVYGPWGRPDMAAYLFTKSTLDGTPIKVFNNGELHRDFTYIDDIIDGIMRVVEQNDKTGYALYNIGNNKPAHLLEFISTIEKYTGKTAKKELLPMQPGDVYKTYADIDALSSAVGYKPSTDIDEGVKQYVYWFKDYYNTK